MNEKTTPVKGILHGKAAQHMTLKRYNPSPDLAHFVEHYWIVRWDVADGQAFETEIVSSPSVNIAVTSESADITGLVTGKFVYTIRGNGAVLGVKFKPGGFYPFFKKPIDRLTNQTVPLSTLYSVTRVKRLAAELGNPDAILVASAEKLLRSKRPEPDATVDAIEEIITQIQQDKTLTSVQAICEKYELSERTLQHAFQRYVGIGLKWIITRYRLQDVIDVIDAGATDWTTLAHDFGFSDQSHFIRDFKKIVGETPAQYSLRKETT
jgi:AraC-like DNA-binding protein